MSAQNSSGALWTDRANTSAAATLSIAYVIKDGVGDFTIARYGPAVAEFIDVNSTGDYELLEFTTNPTGPVGTRPYLRTNTGLVLDVADTAPRLTLVFDVSGNVLTF